MPIPSATAIAVAFNETFAEVGLPVRWSVEEYGVTLKIAGGKERMASLLTDDFVRANDLPTDPERQKELFADWHRRKTARYKAMVGAGELPARPGHRADRRSGARCRLDPRRCLDLGRGVGEGRARARGGRRRRRAVRGVSRATSSPAKKPDPAIYALAMQRLAIGPDDGIVIEDSRNGLLAAVGAGLRCLVTVSSYTAAEDMNEAVLVVTSLGDPGEARARCMANRGLAQVGEIVTLADLDACRTQPLRDKEAV